MATTQSPLLPGDALFGLSSQQYWTWSDENDPFEVMPESELDLLLDGFASSNIYQQSLDYHDSPGQDALPASSSSPDDSSDSNAQFTPSSTADDSTGDQDHASFEIVSNNTSSPAENFDEASLMNSDLSGHSPVRQRVLPASEATLSFSQHSQESSSGPTWRSQEQSWSPSFTTSSEGHGPSTSPYNGFITNESAGAASNSLLEDMVIPMRPSQPSEPWATTALQSITWGNLQQPMFPMQQESFANVMPYQFNEQLGNFAFETPAETVPNIYTGFAYSGPPHLGQAQHHRQHQSLPERTIHDRPQPLATLPMNHNIPQTQTQVSGTRADLAQSTRLRHPDHPKLLAEQNPPVHRQNFRPIAVATGERNSTTASSRALQVSRQRRGGREKNSHLNPDARDRSSKMRKKGACWRCKLQRDPVSLVMSVSSVTVLTKVVPGRWFALRALHHWIAKRPAVLFRLRSVETPGFCDGLLAKLIHGYAY